MITIQLTEQEAALLQEALVIAQNNYADYPNEKEKWNALHQLYVKIDSAMNPMNPMNSLRIQSTVEPESRNVEKSKRV